MTLSMLPTTVRPGFPARPDCLGSVVIPAHNEGRVLGRTLATLAPLAAAREIELVVAANGCTDDTVAVARAAGVAVLDLPAPGKAAALNAGDAYVRAWPRVYLDADVEITPAALRAVLTHLADETPHAARPPARYDLAGATWPVRAFHRARDRMPVLHEHLWGAGVYAVSRTGRARLGAFPDRLADDLFVDAAFAPAEKAVLDTAPVVVRPPRTTRALVAVLRRVYAGNARLVADGTTGASSAATLRALVGTVRGPRSAADAAVYAALALAGRRSPRRAPTWERDDTSRIPA